MAFQAKYYYLQPQAHKMVSMAVKHGDLVCPKHCEQCGKQDGLIDAHHTDYSKPLDVIWLCRACHLIAHGKKEVIHPKRFDAANILRRHLIAHPMDIDMSPKKLARLLGIGKSTVYNVRNDMKGA